MSESAIDWIKRHRVTYKVNAHTPYDCSGVWFAVSSEGTTAWATIGNALGDEVSIDLKTAEQCENLCLLLGITPEPLS